MHFIFAAKLLLISSICIYEITGYAIPPAVQPVAELDLLKFSGRWYEVYSSLIPQLTFTKDWVCVTATYTVRDAQNGVLDLFYNGRLGMPFGPHYNITGTAIAEPDGTGIFSVKYNPHSREKDEYSSDEKVKVYNALEQDLPSSNIPKDTSNTFTDSTVSNVSEVTGSTKGLQSNVSFDLSAMNQVMSTSNATSPPYTETSSSNSPLTTGSSPIASVQLDIQSIPIGIKEKIDTEKIDEVVSIDKTKEAIQSIPNGIKEKIDTEKIDEVVSTDTTKEAIQSIPNGIKEKIDTEKIDEVVSTDTTKEAIQSIPNGIKEKIDTEKIDEVVSTDTTKEAIQSIPNVIKEKIDAEKIDEVVSTDTLKDATSSSSLKSIVTYAKVFVKNLKYVIVKLGPKTFGANNQYEYAIVTTPSKLSLGVLARDLRTFHEKYADEVFDFLRENEFVSIWNRPRPVYQEGNCRYPMYDKGFSPYLESKKIVRQITE